MSIKNIFLIYFLSIFFSSTLFANYVATVEKLKGSATIQRASKVIDVTLGAKILQKDRILTKKDSSLMLLFRDDTIITIGKNSNFYVEDFIYANKKEVQAKFSLINGAINTITGKIGKIAPEKFKIKLSTATIGIRGTEFGVITGEQNSYFTYCTSGTISVRETLNKKEYLVRSGYILNASKKGKITIQPLNNQKVTNIESKSFTIDPKTSSSIIKNSTIQSQTKIGKNSIIEDSNLGTSIQAKNINIKNSTIMSTSKIGDNSAIKKSNLGTNIQSDSLDIE